MNTFRLTAAIIVATCLTACVKEPLYDTDHPGHGKITLTTDWTERGEGIAIPAGHTAHIGAHSAALTGERNTIDHLFEAGTHPIHIYNTADNIAVDMATRTATADYAAGEVGWLFTGTHSVAVEKDRHHEITVPMRQQVRQLTLVIEPKGETAGNIENITASLSGVAGTLDIGNDAHGAASAIDLNFKKITSGADVGKWSATVRLLGVTGSLQKLSGRISFTGGSPGGMELESDLTVPLANFNADKKTPLTLGGEIVDTPSGVGTGTTTINAWQEQGTINGETEY